MILKATLTFLRKNTHKLTLKSQIQAYITFRLRQNRSGNPLALQYSKELKWALAAAVESTWL